MKKDFVGTAGLIAFIIGLVILLALLAGCAGLSEGAAAAVKEAQTGQPVPPSPGLGLWDLIAFFLVRDGLYKVGPSVLGKLRKKGQDS